MSNRTLLAFILANIVFGYGVFLLEQIRELYGLACENKLPPCPPIETKTYLLGVYALVAAFGVFITIIMSGKKGN